MAVIALIHGRDHGARKCVVQMLRIMGHDIRDFEVSKLDNPQRSFNKDIVENLFAGVDCAIVLLTPDEEGILRVSLRQNNAQDWAVHERLRPNVLVEYGLAVGKLGQRVIEISFGFPYEEMPSDWIGLNPIVWECADRTYGYMKERLSTFGIESRLPEESELDSVSYEPPEPPFDESAPPFDFITQPMRLRQVSVSSPWPDQLEAWKRAGFEIKNDYLPNRPHWSSNGWRPLVFKDYDLREYVLAVVHPLPGDEGRMWIGRKR